MTGALAPAGPRASVIVPTYNRLALLRLLLGELDRQTVAYSGYEVIVVDDGSAVDVRRHVSASDYRFSLGVERQANAGASAARERGAARARGDVLVFLDDDMRAPPGLLEAHLDYHRSGDRLVVLGLLRVEEAASRLPLLDRYRLGFSERLADDAKAGRLRITGQYLYTGNVSIPRQLFEEVGGFDPALRLIEDVDLGIRLERARARFTISDAAYSTQRSDPTPTDVWFDRSLNDGVYRSKVARKHHGVSTANPWHTLALMNPVSRPLLLLSATAPRASEVLARGAFRIANLADALGVKRVAIAGATFVYGVQMFRGVGREAGGARGALRDYRDFRCGLRE